MSSKPKLGTGIALPLAFSGGSTETASEQSRVAQSLRMLLLTNHGERAMRPTYGANLRSLAFEPLNANTIRSAERLCRIAINAWEQRVDIVDIVVSFDNDDGSSLAIDVRYRVKGSEDVSTLLQAVSLGGAA